MIQMTSYAMIIMIIIANVILVFGGMFMYYYWFVKPRKTGRTFTFLLLGIPPFMYASCIMQYGFLTQELMNFPHALLRTHSTYGFSFVFAGMLTIVSFWPLINAITFCGKRLDEDYEEEVKEIAKFSYEAETLNACLENDNLKRQPQSQQMQPPPYFQPDYGPPGFHTQLGDPPGLGYQQSGPPGYAASYPGPPQPGGWGNAI